MSNSRVEQADWDLVFFNWAQPAESPPEGWVNDPPEAPDIYQYELDDVTWGSTFVPEPTSFAFLCLGSVALIARLRRDG